MNTNLKEAIAVTQASSRLSLKAKLIDMIMPGAEITWGFQESVYYIQWDDSVEIVRLYVTEYEKTS